MKYVFNSIAILFCLMVIGSCKKTEILPTNIWFYPNPFKDVVSVSLNTNQNYDIVFLGQNNNTIDHISGTGNLSRSFSFGGVQDEVILAEVTINNVKSVYQLYKVK